ncbi:alpha/beta hydrolase [Nonomuraea sp. NPDC046802]|uniref:alpha/beta hydrolase n=1 Tax=Nonomuraea sp. NPDC046802 TaxID=3154919 RepID=UPI003411F4B2
MSLDDATAQFLKQMSEAGGKALHEMTPDEARAMGGALRELYGAGPEMARVEDVVIQAADGGAFGARVLVPVQESRATIVYYHGGGWVVGAIDEFDTLGRTLAQRTGCTVVLVDYRLAPEHRYPVAARDAYDALCWAAERQRELPIIVAGDSAGGNLSAIVSQRSRDEGGPAIALQVLVYPVTDCDLDNASYTDPANQLMLSRASMVWFWDHYAPDRAARANPDASPLRAGDLAGLPPAVVLTAEHDVLRDEGEAYAQRLRQAGVPVEFKRFEGQMHGFFTMVNVLPGSAAALSMVVEAIDGSLR